MWKCSLLTDDEVGHVSRELTRIRPCRKRLVLIPQMQDTPASIQDRQSDESEESSRGRVVDSLDRVRFEGMVAEEQEEGLGASNSYFRSQEGNAQAVRGPLHADDHGRVAVARPDDNVFPLPDEAIFSPTICVCVTRKVSSQLQERQIQWQRRQKNSNCGEPPRERCAQDGVCHIG